MVFSEISVKASTITGAVLGFFCSILTVGFGSGMMNSIAGTRMMYSTMMNYAYADFGLLSILVLTIVGGIIGALIGIIYNWALKLK